MLKSYKAKFHFCDKRCEYVVNHDKIILFLLLRFSHMKFNQITLQNIFKWFVWFFAFAVGWLLIIDCWLCAILISIFLQIPCGSKSQSLTTKRKTIIFFISHFTDRPSSPRDIFTYVNYIWSLFDLLIFLFFAQCRVALENILIALLWIWRK